MSRFQSEGGVFDDTEIRAGPFDTRFEAIVSDDRDVAAGQLRGLAEFVQGGCDDDLLAAMLATRETGHGPNPFGRTRTS